MITVAAATVLVLAAFIVGFVAGGSLVSWIERKE